MSTRSDGTVGGSGRPAQASSRAEGTRAVAYLDPALWARMEEGRSPRELAGAWLELQCRMLDGVARAAVFLRSAHAPLAPAAFWPEGAGDGPTSLLATARRALAETRGVISGHRQGSEVDARLCCAAYPLRADGDVVGAVALEIVDRDEDALREVMRQLQWGTAWMALGLDRERRSRAEAALSRAATALDMIGRLVDEQGFGAAGKTLVTALATHLACDLVALGSAPPGRPLEIVALSHSAEFGRRLNLPRALRAAMDEALDQESIVRVPEADGDEYRVTRDHARLVEMLGAASVLTIPLLAGETPIGALLFHWSDADALDQGRVDLCDAVAAVTGPILEEKRRNDRPLVHKVREAARVQLGRLLGPEHLGRKLASATLILLVLLFSTLEGDYRISAPAIIEGRVQRVSVAPFDGYVASQSARAGDQVREGQVLATLDERDLTLELLRWVSTRQQRIAESDQAIANHDRAQINIIRAQIEQADARIALLREQLARVQIHAPFDGILVSGDLSQSIGAAVRRGEELFRVAPLDSYRVILEVDERDVADVEVGQSGTLKVAALLDDTLTYTVDRVTPVTESRDGRNFFRVEATLREANRRLRPGMEGVAKTDAGRRLVIGIWTESLVEWLRLTLWTWWP